MATHDWSITSNGGTTTRPLSRDGKTTVTAKTPGSQVRVVDKDGEPIAGEKWKKLEKDVAEKIEVKKGQRLEFKDATLDDNRGASGTYTDPVEGA